MGTHIPQSLPTLCGSIMGSLFSLSAKIHNAAYAALGLDYSFVCFGVEDPGAAVAAIRALGVRGMNVSMPYKTLVTLYTTFNTPETLNRDLDEPRDAWEIANAATAIPVQSRTRTRTA
ncbi:hypothetical protein [Pseudomonas sp. YuFO8]|jgi:hypothetical protein|nr:hypothetical protein [Pseudomonas sp. YuFO8]MEB2625361.1 hypothetical protein [Pseudomonas sp. YuFO8]